MNTETYEYALIGNLLNGGAVRRQTLEQISKKGFRPEYLRNSELRALYDRLVAEKTEDPNLLVAAVDKCASAETMGKVCDHVCVTEQDAALVVERLQDAGFMAQVTEAVSSEMNQKASGEVVASGIIGRLSSMIRDLAASSESAGFSLDTLGDPMPEEDDPNCLLAGEFLEKGAALVLTSVTGTGKSSLLMQFAFAWALGREIFGIRPLRPMKIGIFQTENSLRDLAGFKRDIRAGFKRFCGWTDEDLDKATKSITFFHPERKSGDEFLAFVRMEQLKAHFDLIVFDPLTGVVDFDISDNTKMTEYLCRKVDPIIKYDAETKCGLLIAHHTNKPPAANMRAGFGTDQYAQYVGSGAAKFPQWLRSMLVVMPADEEGQFKLVVAKRGVKLKWPKLPGKKTAKPTRLIRHSTPEEGLIFWHEVTSTDAATPKPEKTFDLKSAASKLAAELKSEAKTLTEARALSKELFGRKHGDDVYKAITDKLADYGLVIESTKNGNKRIIGSENGVKNWFSTMRENEIASMRAKLAKMEAES